MEKVMKNEPIKFDWTLMFIMVVLAVWGFIMYKIGEQDLYTGPLIEITLGDGEVFTITGNGSMEAASENDFILRNFQTEVLLGATEKNRRPMGWSGDYHSIIQEEMTGTWHVQEGSFVTVRLEGSPQLKVVSGLDPDNVLGLRVISSIAVLLVAIIVCFLLNSHKLLLV